MLTCGLLAQLPGGLGEAHLLRPSRGIFQGAQASPPEALCVLDDILEPLFSESVRSGFTIKVLDYDLAFLYFADDGLIVDYGSSRAQFKFTQLRDVLASNGHAKRASQR